MISESNSYREKVLESIRSITKTNSSSTLKSAEQMLSKLETQPDYFDILVDLISINELNFSLRKSTAIFILIYIRKHKDTLDKKSRRQTISKIFQLFGQNYLDFSIKLLLTNPCAQLVTCSSEKHQLQRQVAEHLKHIMNSVNHFDPQSLEIIIIISVALFKTLESSQDAERYITFGQQHLFLSQKFQNYLHFNLEIKPPHEIQSNIQSIKQLILLMHYSIVASKEQFKRQVSGNWNVNNIVGLNMSLSMLLNVISNGILITEKSMVNQLFWLEKKNQKILEKLNELRVNYLILLTAVVKELKFEQVQKKNQYTVLIEQIANNVINNLLNLFVSPEGHHTSSPKLEEVIQHEVAFLIVLCGHSLFKSIVLSRSIDLLRTVKKILTFSSKDLNQFQGEPVQFINNMIGFIQNRPSEEQKMETVQSNFVHFEEITDNLQLENIKVLSVRLFKSIIAMDLSLILKIVMEIAKSVSETLFETRKNLELILIVNLIRDQVEPKKDIHRNICDMVISIAQRKPPNRHSSTLYDNFQYFLILMTISSYTSIIKEECPFLMKEILELALQLISDLKYLEANRIMGEIIIQDIFSLFPQDTQLTAVSLIYLRDKILTVANQKMLTENLLDCLFHIFHRMRTNKAQLSFFIQNKVRLIDDILKHTCHCIELQINKPKGKNKNVINKCWNIIRTAGQNPVILSKLISTFELIIGQLVHYLENYTNLDFEEDCFLLMTSFIQYSQKISLFVTSLFKLIPQIFYGQYCGSFGHAYQAIQNFLYYGTESFFRQNKQIYSEIIEMSLYSMNIVDQNFSGEGIFILHSFLLSPAVPMINSQMWNLINDQIGKKIRTGHNSSFIKSSLIGLLGLSLKAADPKWVDPCELVHFIRECAKQIANCKDRYCQKVMVYSTCELLLKHPLKYFTCVIDPLTKILGHLIDKECQQIKKEDLTSNSQKMLKVNIINLITKTPLAQYRDFFIPLISKKFGELRISNDFGELKNLIEELNYSIHSQKMQKMASKQSKKY